MAKGSSQLNLESCRYDLASASGFVEGEVSLRSSTNLGVQPTWQVDGYKESPSAFGAISVLARTTRTVPLRFLYFEEWHISDGSWRFQKVQNQT